MAAGLDSYGARKAGTGAGGQPPCSSVCEDLLAGCDTMISYVEYIFPLAVYFSIVGIPIDCSAEPTTDCVEGGKYEYFEDDNSVCPTPLMYIDPYNTKDMWMSGSLSGVADCSRRCPTSFYDYDICQLKSLTN